MPLEKKEDYALGDLNAKYCSYCVDKAGQLLPFEKILDSNAHYYKESQGLTEQAATKMARDLLYGQPAWKHLRS